MNEIILLLLGKLESEDERLFAEELVQKHFDEVYGFCIARTKDKRKADEITSLVWEKVFNHLSKLGPLDDSQRRSYIYKVAVSMESEYYESEANGLDSLSSDKLRRLIESGMIEEEDGESLEEDLEKRDLFLRIEKYLNTISKDDVNALYLRYSMDFSYSEIAKEMNMPKSTLRDRMKKHENKISDIIGRYEEGK